MAKMVNRNYLMVTMLIGLVVGWMACSLFTMSGDEYRADVRRSEIIHINIKEAQAEFKQYAQDAKAEQARVELMIAESNRILAENQRVLAENQRVLQQIEARRAQGY